MLKIQKLALRQGLPKRHSPVKRRMLQNQLVDSLSTNFLGVGVPSNAWYGIEEIQAYFHALISQRCSGNLGVDLIHDFHGFNIPDQETVKVRCEKLEVEDMESNINSMLLEKALQLPTYQSEYKFARMKHQNTKLRKIRAKNMVKQRPRQRERGVEPPAGRWLSIDFTLKPLYLKDYDEYIKQDHPIAEFITKDRRRRSTVQFMGYHTVYDHEFGSRQILGVHMLRKNRSPEYKDGWRRENLADVVEYLIDPIRDRIPISGITGDGDYYNIGVIRYLLSRNLDFVIRANNSEKIKEFIKKYHVEYLKDGTGVEVKARTQLGSGKRSIDLRLVIVKRGQELVPLVLPPYSKLSPEQALLCYEERFGIETAYREVYNLLPKTCSLSPSYRLAIYAMTCWFFNILLNYYQIVVMFSHDPKGWQASLSRLKSHLDLILGQIMEEVVKS